MLRVNHWGVLLLLFCLTVLLGVITPQMYAQQSIDVRIERWLAVKQVSGDVERFGVDGVHPAAVNDRLTEVGDGIRTGPDSASSLEVDTGVGTIDLRENTEITIQDLALAQDNGRITHLYVSRGGVVLNLRRFNHPGSELEIETPSGVSGVRGTAFGLTVQPDGATGVATRTGAVYARAQAVEVTVNDGFQTLIRPGEPPLEPTPIPPEPFFEYEVEYIIRGGLRRLMLVGTVDPINQVFVEREQQVLGPDGQFQYEVPAARGAQVKVLVITPLGDEAEYEISLL